MPGKTPKKPRKRKKPEERLEYLSALFSEKGKPYRQRQHLGPAKNIRELEKTYEVMGKKMLPGGKLQIARSTKGFADLRDVKISEEEWKRIEEERRKRKEKGGNK